jgi:hypothetical protein
MAETSYSHCPNCLAECDLDGARKIARRTLSGEDAI